MVFYFLECRWLRNAAVIAAQDHAVAVPPHDGEVAAMIAACSARYPQARCFVTSRIIGYEPERLRNAGFAHATLVALSRPRTEGGKIQCANYTGLDKQNCDGLVQLTLENWST